MLQERAKVTIPQLYLIKGVIKMKLGWYLFEHSYLTDIQINPINCTLNLRIDAKMTYDHPKTVDNMNLEESYVEIEVLFEGVQYLRMVNSAQLLMNPNDDLGSIEQFDTKGLNSISPGLTIKKNNDKNELLLDLSDGNKVQVLSKSKEVTFLNFISEMISFEIGFEKLSIKENE
jgi:hypothetical protein